jgi:repressor LexA
MLPSLTARQKAIYDFLLKTIREKGFAPSIPEIGRQFKIASTNGVSDHLKALEKRATSAGSASAPSRSSMLWARQF